MKKFLRVAGKIALFLLSWIALIGVSFLVSRNLFKDDAALWRLLNEFIPFIWIVLDGLIFIKFIEKKNSFSYSIKLKNVPKDTLKGLALGIIWNGAVFLMFWANGVLEFGNINSSVLNNILIWSVALFFNTLMQELVVRGYVFSLIKREYNSIIAIIITSILFILPHGGAFKAGFIAILNVFSTGVLLSVIILYTKSLWASIIIHFIWNFVFGIVFGIVSLANDYPILISTKLNGKSLVTGGGAGIEGSAFVLIINVIMIIGLIYLKKLKDLKNKHCSLKETY